ncbi:hypothetical protein YC2023_024873 [Brassica napus]
MPKKAGMHERINGNFSYIILIEYVLWDCSCRRPLTPQEIKLEDSPVRALFSKIESLLLMLYEIAYGEDIKTFLSAILYVAIVDTVGSYINLLTILYICLVCAMTIPVLYLQFQEVIDNFIREVSEEKNKLLEVLKSNVLNKIPRATKEE